MSQFIKLNLCISHRYRTFTETTTQIQKPILSCFKQQTRSPQHAFQRGPPKSPIYCPLDNTCGWQSVKSTW